jgi:hypothetical protein
MLCDFIGILENNVKIKHKTTISGRDRIRED